MYCLSMAAPGSVHYGYYFISYEFVYVGNRYGKYTPPHCRCASHLIAFILISVRNILVMFALFSLLAGLAIFVTTVLLIIALRKVNCFLFCVQVESRLNWNFSKYFQQEYERKIRPWLWSFAVFTVLRALATLFFGIVNDLIFPYNILMLLFWILSLIGCVWSWLIVYTFFVELAGLSKLEDLAQLRVS